jgi:hypothetical protein
MGQKTAEFGKSKTMNPTAFKIVVPAIFDPVAEKLPEKPQEVLPEAFANMLVEARAYLKQKDITDRINKMRLTGRMKRVTVNKSMEGMTTDSDGNGLKIEKKLNLKNMTVHANVLCRDTCTIEEKVTTRRVTHAQSITSNMNKEAFDT